MFDSLKATIEAAWADRQLLQTAETRAAIDATIEALDKGKLRCAEPLGDAWQVNDWVKKAVIMYFPIRQMATMELPPFEYHDKMALKVDYAGQGVRVVPPATARYGAFLAKGVILMPSYVNIGAYVDEGTMVDTWATVGSCAQIGKGVHLSGGVGIGGVLEPVQAAPGDHRGWRVHWQPLHCGGRRAGGCRGGVGGQYGLDGLLAHHRRVGHNACGIQGLRAAPLGGDPGNNAQGISRRHFPCTLRPDHWATESFH
jgi:hypothetical protein